MNTCFDRRAQREGGWWLKDIFTPDAIRQENMLGYAGAEFEFPTCPALSRGVQEAAARGVFGYTLARGPYLEAVQWWMQTVRGYEVEKEWIVSTHGTIFSLATTIRMTTKPGEGIIILTPGYNRYEQAATRLGRRTCKVPLKEQSGAYTMDWQALESAMADSANRVLVLCHPNNPTGRMYTRAELEQVAELSRKYQVTVYSDEIFGDIVFDGKTCVPYVSVAGKNALAISCSGMGKTFSLTGVNHANVIIENDALRERFIAQRDADHYGSVDPMTWAALVSAYTPEGYEWLLALREYLQENVRLLTEFMQKNLPAAVVTKPEGTCVVWVDYEKLGLNEQELHQLLSVEGLFDGDMGEDYYGKPTCVRYSLAVPRAELKRSLARLKETLVRRGFTQA